MIRDLQDEIIRLKKYNNITIMAHSYQSPDILEIADYTGDSFKLSTDALSIDSEVIIMCGVRFMAETIKILSPQKRVIMPIETATCPMAEQISPERVREFKKEHPDFLVVAYINTTAALKAECDICVTSSSALKIVNNLENKNILFIPDKNLGGYVKELCPNKNIVLWDGYCPVHNSVTEEDVIKAKAIYPNATVLMHPELPAEVIKHSDMTGSTAAILNYALQNDEDCIIGTEKSIVDFLALKKPYQKFHLLSKKLICPDMRIINLADVYSAVSGTGGAEIYLDEDLRLKAKKPIDAMIKLG